MIDRGGRAAPRPRPRGPARVGLADIERARELCGNCGHALVVRGLVEARAGNREAARRELSRALVLLQREDALRLILFGGGFKRDALLALCRMELRTCGGTA